MGSKSVKKGKQRAEPAAKAPEVPAKPNAAAKEITLQVGGQSDIDGGSDTAGEDSQVEDDEDEDDDEGVDKQAMEKLMNLLGDIDPEELGLGELDGEDEDEDEDAADSADDVSNHNDDEEDEEDLEGDSQSNGTDAQSDEETEQNPDKSQKSGKREGADKKQEEILDRILQRFKLDVPFFETQTLTYSEPLAIGDVADDLSRELQFYKQSLWAAQHAMKLFKSANLPFSRPDDYYAEMLKSDEHMERIRQKLLDESASIKASEAAKKQRHLKKFGKQVQVEKQRERERSKKSMDEKVREFKKKRKHNSGEDDDGVFDVETLNENSSTRAFKRAKNAAAARGPGGGKSRAQRDAKFGKPRTSRRPKENDRASANDIFGAGGRGGKALQRGPPKGKAKRPGKSRRH